MAEKDKSHFHIFEQKSDGIYLDGVKIKGVKSVRTHRTAGELPLITVEMFIKFPDPKEPELNEEQKNTFMKDLKTL